MSSNGLIQKKNELIERVESKKIKNRKPLTPPKQNDLIQLAQPLLPGLSNGRT